MAYQTYGYNPHEVKNFPVPVVGMWRRFAAWLIDSVVVGSIGFGLMLLGLYLAYDANPNASYEQLVLEFDTTVWVLNGGSVLIAVVYYVASWAMGGQTLGKWLLGIKVVGDDGTSPSLAASVLRYLGYLLNDIVFGFGFLAIAFDKRKRGWHDKIASTYVVRSTVEVPPNVRPVFLYPSESNTGDMMAVALYIFSVCILPCALVLILTIFLPEMASQIAP